MTAILAHGPWASISTIVNEPNLLVRSVKRKPSRDKNWKKDAVTRADSRGKYTNPTLTITMEVDVQAQTGLGSIGVGEAIGAGLANFGSVWRGHNPSDGKVIVDDIDDNASVDDDEPLTATLVFVHKPFVTS